MTATAKPNVEIGAWIYCKSLGRGMMVLNGKTYAIEVNKDGGRVVGLRLVREADDQGQQALYDVEILPGGVCGACDCPDHVKRPERPGGCKHMHAVRTITAALKAGQNHG